MAFKVSKDGCLIAVSKSTNDAPLGKITPHPECREDEHFFSNTNIPFEEYQKQYSDKKLRAGIKAYDWHGNLLTDKGFDGSDYPVFWKKEKW